jgi:hypothetical protein
MAARPDETWNAIPYEAVTCNGARRSNSPEGIRIVDHHLGCRAIFVRSTPRRSPFGTAAIAAGMSQ